MRESTLTATAPVRETRTTAEVEDAVVAQPKTAMLLEPAGVEAWLVAQEGHAIVGYRGQGKLCPLARYLHECNGGPHDTVMGPVYISCLPGEHGAPTRASGAWAAHFVWLVDHSSYGPITAGEALRHLREALREYPPSV